MAFQFDSSLTAFPSSIGLVSHHRNTNREGSALITLPINEMCEVTWRRSADSAVAEHGEEAAGCAGSARWQPPGSASRRRGRTPLHRARPWRLRKPRRPPRLRYGACCGWPYWLRGRGRASGLALLPAGGVAAAAVGALLPEHAESLLVAIRGAFVGTPPRERHQHAVQPAHLHLAEV